MARLQPLLRPDDADHMLQCRACNTRYERGAKACPSCGRRASEAAVDTVSSGPGASGSQGSSMSGPLPPTQLLEEEVDVDLELGELDIFDESPRPVEKSAGNRARRKPDDPPAVRGRVWEPGPQVLALEPRQVRTLVAEQPGLLEKGLGIHSDEDGQPVGVDYATPVGDIDLLARDKLGDLVVVMVPDPEEFDGIVPEIVQRIGWVRKHLADGSDVRGIVVMQELPEAVGYAAAGVAGMVGFKAFRVALTFHDIQP